MRMKANVHCTLYLRKYENNLVEWWITYVTNDGKSALFDEGAALSYEDAVAPMSDALKCAVEELGRESAVVLRFLTP